MKQLGLLIIFLAIGTILSGCVSTAPTQSELSADEAEKITEKITQFSKQWGQVSITKDMAHLKRIWSDDFSYTMPDGTVFDKKAGLSFFEDSTDTSTSEANTAFNVRVYSINFAVADGDHHSVGKDKDGNSFSRKSRFTNVWIRKNGTWQVVAGHSSRLE
ncbi:nuclear transport factor 2 family protein [bacterium]|nr:nuclear transport factor 2 family protein [bacterium]